MSLVIDNSTRALTQTAAQVSKLVAQLPATIEAQVAEIQANQNILADQAGEIAANQKAIETAVREAGAEIRLQVKEDEDKVLNSLLVSRGLVATTEADIEDGRDRIEAAERKANSAEYEAVKSAESKLHSQYGSKIYEITSNHKVEVATLNANSSRDADLIAGLKAQVADLQETIRLNREAETARTQALAQSSVTINQGK